MTVPRLFRRLAPILTLLALAACTVGQAEPPPPDGAFRLATFNIAYIRDPSGLPRWEARRDAVTFALKNIDADLIAFQEMETFAGGKFNRTNRQRDWIMETVPGYAVAASGDPAEFPNTQPILFRPDRFDLLDQGFFYFSDTPSVIYSRSFDGGFDAYATTARFRDKESGGAFTVVNLHTNRRSTENRIGAAKVIAARIRPLLDEGERVFVAGDFNAMRNAPTVAIVKEEGMEGTDILAPTYHFGLGLTVVPAVDHILHGPGVEQLGAAVVHRDRLDGAYPSDHFPVSADFRLTGPITE